jgi:hypothetical protein
MVFPDQVGEVVPMSILRLRARVTGVDIRLFDPPLEKEQKTCIINKLYRFI